MIDVKATLSESEERMEMAALFLEDALAKIRAGRANVAIVSGVRVDSYGSMVPLNQVANVSVPDARTIARTMARLSVWPYHNPPRSAAATSPSSATRLPRRQRWRCAT